jgi:uncharacterized protein YndB with AHSA1/START domain
MTYELKLERLLDAPSELVFDTFVDPDAQAEMFDDPDAYLGGTPRFLDALQRAVADRLAEGRG